MTSDRNSPLRDVTVIGESLVDLVETDGVLATLPGGSPMNVAVGLGRLGRAVALVTEFSTDALGQTLRHHLEASDVDLSALVVAERTSSATARLAADGSAMYEFDLTWTISPSAPVPASRLLHVGSIGSWLEPGAAAVHGMVEQWPSGKVSFDPNIRPSLITDRDATVRRLQNLVGLSDLVKLSEEDADWLFPGRSADDVLARLLEWEASIAVLTRGAAGATARAGEIEVALAAPSVQVADTIGAGDSFMAGLLDGWLAADLASGDELDAATLQSLVRRGLTAASITVSRPGANPPWLEDLA